MSKNQTENLDEAPDDHFVRVESRTGLPINKPLINVHISDDQPLNDTPEYIDFGDRRESRRVTMVRG